MGAPRMCVAAAMAAVLLGCGFHGQRADWKDVLPPQEPTPLLSEGTTRVESDEVMEYRLGNGDLITVDILGHDEFSGALYVDERGKIQLSNTNEVVDVSGLTLPEAQGKVARVVSPYVVGQPDVRVSLAGSKSKYYYLLGGVWHPGLYQMGAKVVRLRDAIAWAGFFQEFRADQCRVGVITPDPERPTYVIANAHDILMGEDKYNVVIKPGDVIFVQDKIIFNLDKFLFMMFRETENASTANKAVKFWEDAKEGQIGEFSYPRQSLTLIY